MNLPRELSEIVCEKSLWIACSRKNLKQISQAQLSQLKRRGWLNLLQSHKNAVHWAIKRGDTQVLEWLYSKGHRKFKTSYALCYPIVKTGNVQLFKWFWNKFGEKNTDFSVKTSTYFAIETIGLIGEIQIAEWFYRNVSQEFPIDMYQAAAKMGNLRFLIWANKKRKLTFWQANQVAANAAVNGHWNVLDWLYAEFRGFDISVLKVAKSAGNQRFIVEWLADKIHS